MEAIDVIIPTFNRPEYCKVMLESLYSVAHGTRIRPIIVDNGSRKKTREMLLSWKMSYATLTDEVKKIVADPELVLLDSNKGYAGAMNEGIRRSNPLAKYLILMHNDCIPFPGWAGEMEACFQQADEDVAVYIPRTNYANENGICVQDFRSKFSAIKPPNKERISSEDIVKVIDDVHPDRVETIQQLRGLTALRTIYSPEISSFCMMVRAEMFRKYGFFDEDFWPRMWEDKYWFQPLERDGWICMIANYSYVFHFGNITSDGPGFSFPDIAMAMEAKYKQKCLERDAKLSTVSRNAV